MRGEKRLNCFATDMFPPLCLRFCFGYGRLFSSSNSLVDAATNNVDRGFPFPPDDLLADEIVDLVCVFKPIKVINSRSDLLRYQISDPKNPFILKIRCIYGTFSG